MAVTAGESVVPASELAAARAQIAQLQRMLGKKTMEAEILKEAVEFAREKSGLRSRPCQARTTSEAGLLCPWRSALTRFANNGSPRRLGRWPHRTDVSPTCRRDPGRRSGAEITALPTYG
jgi:hypothetical protein